MKKPIITERNIIVRTYETLITENLRSVADIIDKSCYWSSTNALSKVKFWLHYGLKHDGDYSNAKFRRSCRVKFCEVEDIKRAFDILDEFREQFSIDKNP